MIDLGFTQLQVVDACSGLRYMIPLAVLSLVMAYWFNAALWKKALLVLSSLPLAIAVNSSIPSRQGKEGKVGPPVKAACRVR